MRTIEFVYPDETAAVSVTGNKCELNCRHCKGRYLQHMNSIDGFDKNALSVLLSGGYNKNGSVPIDEGHLKQLKGYKLNVHPGLVDERQAELIGRYAHTVSFDFPCGDDVIKKVYGLNKKMSDYIMSYKLLRIYCKKVVPHICIGLGGNELRAVNLLAGLGFDEIVLLALIPNEYFRNPPSIEKMIGIMKKLKSSCPDRKISLGCMRAGGNYRRELDMKAIDYADRIVMPHRDAVELARKKGLRIIEKHECCAL